MALPPVLRDRLRLPVVGSPLFIVSGPELVIAQCKAGIVGSFPSLNARPVSQIVHKTNNRLEEDVALCAKYKVPVVITSLGAREDVNRAVHGWGGIVLHDVISSFFARKAVEKGADGLIPVAAGAGGHASELSPFAMIQELREWFDGPIALSGAIANGRAVLAAQAMGADLAYVGSAFIATQEARAVEGYKEMIVANGGEDIVYTNLFTGVHGNYLRPSVVAAGLDPDHLPQADPSKMNFASGGNQSAKAWRDIWGCGQGIGAVKSVPTAGELVARLSAEYEAAKRELAQKTSFTAGAPLAFAAE